MTRPRIATFKYYKYNTRWTDVMIWLSMFQSARCSLLRIENHVSFGENLLNTDQGRWILESGSINSIFFELQMSKIFWNFLTPIFIFSSWHVFSGEGGTPCPYTYIFIHTFFYFKKLILIFLCSTNKKNWVLQSFKFHNDEDRTFEL